MVAMKMMKSRGAGLSHWGARVILRSTVGTSADVKWTESEALACQCTATIIRMSFSRGAPENAPEQLAENAAEGLDEAEVQDPCGFSMLMAFAECHPHVEALLHRIISTHIFLCFRLNSWTVLGEIFVNSTVYGEIFVN